MFCVYYLLVNTEHFKKSIKTHNLKENYVATSLARKYNSNLCFNHSSDLSKWDYVLYSIDDAWACSCEQQEDNVCSNEEGNLCFELYTYNEDGTKRLGKLNYTKAKYIIYIITKMNLVLSLKTKCVKDLVNLHQSHGILNTYTPKNFDDWWAKHDTAPTECALLPFDQVVLAAQSSRFSFHELDIQSNIYHGL
jgi:hypothetical protein